MSDAFALDPRLAADTTEFAALDLCSLRLMEDSRFAWVVMVPKRAGMAEIIDLDESDRALLFDEITRVSRALRTATACHKLNIGALGNIVRQLHVHVVARFDGDAAWPGPVWGAGKAVPYAPETKERLIQQIRAALQARTAPVAGRAGCA